MHLKNHADIFTNQKKFLKWPLRMPRATWILGLALVGVMSTIAFTLPHAKETITKKQTSGANPQPIPSVAAVGTVPSLPPDTTLVSDYLTAGAPTAGNYQQTSNSLIQMQQQIDAQAQTCLQQSQQAYNQIVGIIAQKKKLEVQRNALDAAIGKSTTDAQNTALQNQRDRIQQSIDQLYTSISNAQQRLDQLNSDCQQRISDMQTRQSDLQSQYNDQLNEIFQYQLPSY